MKYKKLAYDILGILVISSLLGLAYNFYSSKTLPLLKQEVQVKTISENELFGNQASGNNVSTESNKVFANKDTSHILNNTSNKVVSEKSTIEKTVEVKSETINSGNTAIKNIGIDLVKKYIKDSRIVLIDARSPEAYSAGRIGNAINIFPLDENKESYFNRLTSLDRDKIILIYCDGGDCDLSHHLANDLVTFGFKKIFIYVGGWEEWSKKMVHNGK
jgi:rhodanese-related sulfurtransferase